MIAGLNPSIPECGGNTPFLSRVTLAAPGSMSPSNLSNQAMIGGTPHIEGRYRLGGAPVSSRSSCGAEEMGQFCSQMGRVLGVVRGGGGYITVRWPYEP